VSDSSTTPAELRRQVDEFVAARDWHQFHNSKDLAVSIAIEAAELMEEFQWLDAPQVAAAIQDPEARTRASLELADVLIYCLSLANAMRIDLSETIQTKLALSGQKYPVDAYRGRARKPGGPDTEGVADLGA
jgi:NTP pyrophosphatase (non-canonical NTP hydrolase)